MAYIIGNPKTKKAAKELLANGERLQVVQLSPFGENMIENGTAFIEGPHYPEPHRWYARAEVVDGFVTSLK